ncbi:hypothetical protein CMI37_16345 [Candidatus Pacearchaeota archaeon]|nr:hypothetical protein [Candidatus Pacearchaeota archaeon]|tara:strand:+ start:111 stop:953 length:843 start_codon:yes stop_codon:yes gene_type:complete
MVVAPIDSKSGYDSNIFYERMTDLAGLTQINFNRPEEAKKTLGTLVAGDENFISSATTDEAMNLQRRIAGESQVSMASYVSGNFSEVSADLGEDALAQVVIGMSAEKGASDGNDGAVDALEKYRAAEKKLGTSEGQQEYVAEQIKAVDPAFRGIVAAFGGEAIIRTSLDSLQAGVRAPFRKEDGSLDGNGMKSFIKANMDHYIASGSDEEKGKGAQISLAVAGQAYQLMQGEKARQEHAKEMYDAQVAAEAENSGEEESKPDKKKTKKTKKAIKKRKKKS